MRFQVTQQLACSYPGPAPRVPLRDQRRQRERDAADLASGRLERAVWSRNDGGTIAVTQHYQTVEARDVVAEQHASIRIPHMAADLVATYSNFSLAKTVASADRP